MALPALGELRCSRLDRISLCVHIHPYQEPSKWPLAVRGQEWTGEDMQEFFDGEDSLADRLDEEVFSL